MRVRVVEDGKGKGEGEGTMVFVHGWPDTYHGFDEQVEYFKDRFFSLFFLFFLLSFVDFFQKVSLLASCYALPRS